MRTLVVLGSTWLALGVGPAAPATGGKIAVLLTVDIPQYAAALRGFQTATPSHKIVAQYDMRADEATGRGQLGEILTKTKPDLILAVGPGALRVATDQPIPIPIVYTMVPNPPSVVGGTAKQVTGASYNVSVEETIQLIRRLGTRKVGVVYDPAKTGFIVQAAEAAAKQTGVQLVTTQARSPKDAIAALDGLLAQGIDLWWMLPDDTYLQSDAVVKEMVLRASRRNVPVLGLSEAQANWAATLALSIANFEDIGRQAGELANLVLAGKPAGDLPFTTVRQPWLTVNLKLAKKLGFEIPPSVVASANKVIQP
jgi:putative ABC transport system substrate-binding protein